MAVSLTVEQLASELRRRRVEMNLSLRQVEELTGISAATLSRFERGSKPELPVIESLAQWLGVNVVTAGVGISSIGTDEDLKKAIHVHLRAKKNLPEDVAHSIVEAFEILMQIEMQKAKRRDHSSSE